MWAGYMNLIDEKVTSINDAISIIDQIAFQTNILSLTAAVEAATAGEAGKGFARFGPLSLASTIIRNSLDQGFVGEVSGGEREGVDQMPLP